ncbi:MAG: efflux RND transporter permease subunit [Deltaproteobacteria bacterium]|nr:efflux RND transporter permease subunit [Deltaproteobacteria bacterium]
MPDQEASSSGLIRNVVSLFLTGRLSILFIVFSLAVGAAAIFLTPREEDPQIVVPLADVYVQAPGASAEEVEKLVATPLERLLWQIDGVEYVYSVSRRDMALVTVRFYVGEDRERSLVKLHNKITMNIDQAPPIVKGWVIKPIEIDDVPIVTVTLYSASQSDHALRRIGEEVLSRLAEATDISRTALIGGRQREVRVEVDPERMAGLGVSIMDVKRVLSETDASVTAGAFSRMNRQFSVTCDSFVIGARDVEELVVGIFEGRPVYLRDIAVVFDGPEEASHYSRIGFSHFYRQEHNLVDQPSSFSAVTLALAKKKGTNAVVVANDVLKRLDLLRQTFIPHDVRVEITRNYGDTAQQKVSDLLNSLFFAILTVVALLAFSMGWREALVVAVAVPISFSLALFVNYLFGYTINRVTLFALILSLGLVVDDPITNVDNIQRHIVMRRREPKAATLFAVDEVLPPVIMSTLAIIVSFSPMFFITGMMGPYMAPMAANVPLTVAFSTVCALTVVPWMSYLLLKNLGGSGGSKTNAADHNTKTDVVNRVYRVIVNPLLESRSKRWLLLFAVIGLLLFSIALAVFRQVPLKMLPFDNKNEFQIVLDMPEGTPLEATDRAVRAFERYLRQVPEVTHFVSYTGVSSPMDFNGMVRHYYVREGANLADIRVNLAGKERREYQSHEIVLRIRKDLEAIASEQQALIKIVEVPPGPPVIATVVAEVYGGPGMSYRQLAEGAGYIKQVMGNEPFVADIDDTLETPRERINFVLDKEKAALHNVSAETITMALRTSLSGKVSVTVHEEGERQALPLRIIVPRVERTGIAKLSHLPVKTGEGKMVPLAELGFFSFLPEDQPIYHKNLERVVYVLGETAGRAPAAAILDMQKRLTESPPPAGIRINWAGEGEWKITLRVFRDLGLAYAAALLGIYILLVIQLNSFGMPFLIMVAIPLTLIGIMPGFWFLNLLFSDPVGGFQNPVFFTATSMIGMIALGGIVIRNSLVLIEFIQDAVRRGVSLKEAILQSGVTRLRPIVLTAATTALGVWPITLDPIFSGLAWALIFGLVASTLFTLVVVPVTFYAGNRENYSTLGA